MSETAQAEHAGRLIARIEAEAQAECDRILAAARDEAARLRATAGARARAHLKAEVAALRRDGTQAVARMYSRFCNAKRQMNQAEGARAQERALGRLCGGVDALWADEAARAQWCAQVLEEARAHLLPGAWRVAFPKGWAKPEQAQFAAAIEAHCGTAPEMTEAADMRSGLVVRADTARIDATGPALCRPSVRLRAQLQNELEQMMGLDEERGAGA
ncbi:MAG: hypothetical protein R3D85_14770 [Paracoccaceae bacterium]